MPVSLVLDASLAIRLVLPGPARASLRSLVARWREEGRECYAPTLWIYELTSALSKGVPFGALTEGKAEHALQLLRDLGVQLVPPDRAQVDRAFIWTRRLNRAAAYDSFYLALAEELGSDLWTADRRLVNAVDLPWVRLAGVPS